MTIKDHETCKRNRKKWSMAVRSLWWKSSAQCSCRKVQKLSLSSENTFSITQTVQLKFCNFKWWNAVKVTDHSEIMAVCVTSSYTNLHFPNLISQLPSCILAPHKITVFVWILVVFFQCNQIWNMFPRHFYRELKRRFKSAMLKYIVHSVWYYLLENNFHKIKRFRPSSLVDNFCQRIDLRSDRNRSKFTRHLITVCINKLNFFLKKITGF